MSKESRETLRDQIDELDDMIAKALNQRAECAIKIGHIKRESDEKIFDPVREESIFSRLSTNNAGPLTSAAIVRIFERIIDESRRLERTEAFEKSEDSGSSGNRKSSEEGG